jgi:transposase
MTHYRNGWDAHKRYSCVSVLDATGQVLERTRVNHQPGAIRSFLSSFPKGTPVALESVGNWYWMVDEMEAAGCQPRMADARKAKLMMGHVNKTDKLDADGLATLLHNGTLPTVWLPPGPVRDERELPCTRMAVSKVRTALKNRIHAALAKYGLSLETGSDIFASKWRRPLLRAMDSLLLDTQRCVQQELELLDQLNDHIARLEERILERVEISQDLKLLKTLPGVGDILAIVIHHEVGSIRRFPAAENFASYCGTVPKASP